MWTKKLAGPFYITYVWLIDKQQYLEEKQSYLGRAFRNFIS